MKTLAGLRWPRSSPGASFAAAPPARSESWSPEPLSAAPRRLSCCCWRSPSCGRSGSSSPMPSSAPRTCPTSCSASAWGCRLLFIGRRPDGRRQAPGRDRGARGRISAEEHPRAAVRDRRDRARVGLADHAQAAAGRRGRGGRRRPGPGGADARAVDRARCSTPGRSTAPRGGAAPGSSTSRDARSRAADDRVRELLHRVPRRRRPRGHRLAAGGAPARSLEAPAARRVGRVGSGGDRRLLEDLHPRRLRDRAVPQADLPGARAPRRARLPVPLLDLRPVHGWHGHLRPGGPPAAAATARDRLRRRAARGRATSRAGSARRGGTSRSARRDWPGRGSGPLHRPAHRLGAAAAQGDALPVPRPLVVPAGRGRAVRVHRAGRDRASTWRCSSTRAPPRPSTTAPTRRSTARR